MKKTSTEELNRRGEFVLSQLSYKTPTMFTDLLEKLPGLTMRDLDRALQRLRKAGRAKYVTGGWLRRPSESAR